MEIEKLGDWSKWLEKNFSPERMIPTLPVIIRLDGNNFSKWTKQSYFTKPYDFILSEVMALTTKKLLEETSGVIGYTQSDEITLILYSDNRLSSIYHEGKKQKILSKLTGVCVNTFNELIRDNLYPEIPPFANFDCRIYQTPTLKDAASQLLWRELDAIRNSIQMLAQYHLGHKKTQNKNTTELKKELDFLNVSWDKMDEPFRRGRYFKKRTIENFFTQDELEKLPPKHEAHKNPGMIFKRSIIEEVKDFPYLKDVNNVVDLIFNDNYKIKLKK